MGVDLLGRGVGFAEFWTERRLASLSSVRPDGRPHVVPVGVTVDFASGIARVITFRHSVKARLVAGAGVAGLAVAVCQFEGAHWSTLEGRAVVREDAESVADAVARYARRYRQPKENPARVVLEIAVSRVLGNR
ncbi:MULTISPECIES: pyridoxamine 5'-phosphate oxidase family protein [unclassified Crossiella]|uniref:pyridoxamine 5'-phosphate oxidase family protein n=1 Tax=unclassified Crossiella TaxID=2620835 RepID=UPI001FFF7BE8|nr:MULTISPECIES: pyridoxamine 5'-phosphate oxidase family protein [unclassified Crossiella]MCK2239444.1 pyridoxamine 5'-phosphate oxidase family protein [Crossiella sp. S99.2]MCK2252139.1 pyridoxamine 5'-phosphate oxidase family protein [Crossiella sp. S99.1]